MASPVVIALVALIAACEWDGAEERVVEGAEAPAPMVFDTTRVRIATEADTFPLRVEVAVTGEERAFGLMERAALPAEAGMLFVYTEPQPAETGFWMFRTRIPLDIAFLDAEGRILSIKAMEPCESPYPEWCPTYPAGVEYRAALEVNRGYFAERGIEPGARVLFGNGLEALARE